MENETKISKKRSSKVISIDDLCSSRNELIEGFSIFESQIHSKSLAIKEVFLISSKWFNDFKSLLALISVDKTDLNQAQNDSILEKIQKLENVPSIVDTQLLDCSSEDDYILDQRFINSFSQDLSLINRDILNLIKKVKIYLHPPKRPIFYSTESIPKGCTFYSDYNIWIEINPISLIVSVVYKVNNTLDLTNFKSLTNYKNCFEIRTFKRVQLSKFKLKIGMIILKLNEETTKRKILEGKLSLRLWKLYNCLKEYYFINHLTNNANRLMNNESIFVPAFRIDSKQLQLFDN